MSPEEIEWDNSGARRGATEQFHAHLSGDIHSAGSIIRVTPPSILLSVR